MRQLKHPPTHDEQGDPQGPARECCHESQGSEEQSVFIAAGL